MGILNIFKKNKSSPDANIWRAKSQINKVIFEGGNNEELANAYKLLLESLLDDAPLKYVDAAIDALRCLLNFDKYQHVEILIEILNEHKDDTDQTKMKAELNDAIKRKFKLKCVQCWKEFEWKNAYYQHAPSDSYLYNPPEYGNYWPRLFCPNCGFLIAEWDMDSKKDKGRWRWYAKNVETNVGQELPSGSGGPWIINQIPNDVVTILKDNIDVKYVKKLHNES